MSLHSTPPHQRFLNYVICQKSSCSMFIKILFYKFYDTSMWSPSKYSPLDTIHLSHLRFHCWKHPWNFSSLKPFSSDVISLLIVVTSPQIPPPQHQFAFGEQEKIAGG